MSEAGLDKEGADQPVLERALWRDLASEASDDRAFGEAWLGLLCRMVDGTIGGALLQRGESGMRTVATFPAGLGIGRDLAEAARRACESGSGAVQRAGSAPIRLAYPVRVRGVIEGAAALELSASTVRDPRPAMRQLQWALGLVRERLLLGTVGALEARSARAALALDLLAACLDAGDAAAAGRTATTELAVRFGCERVSLGFRRRGRCHPDAISHSAAFGRRMTLVRGLADAMDEAIDQRAVVLHPAPDDALLTTGAHARFARLHGDATVLTVPLLVRDAFLGAITFERPATMPFERAEIETAEAIAAILGPALADKREVDRPLPLKIAAAFRAEVVRLVGPVHAGRKLGLAAAAAAVLLGATWRTGYDVHAKARIEGSVQRAIVAPYDGFIGEALVRPGDQVRTGQLLAAMDDRDLVLERLRWATERQVHVAEYDQALGAAKRADAARLGSEVDEADAQLRLADAQLSRARLVAPFDALVVSGDLSQSIGAPARRGDVLFELARLDDYRVELLVGETQIGSVHAGERGSLVVASVTGKPLRIEVTRVTPVAVAKDGQMYFRVEARLPPGLTRLRPGMEGVAHIHAGRARVVWIWSRPFFAWCRLTAWSWIP